MLDAWSLFAQVSVILSTHTYTHTPLLNLNSHCKSGTITMDTHIKGLSALLPQLYKREFFLCWHSCVSLLCVHLVHFKLPTPNYSYSGHSKTALRQLIFLKDIWRLHFCSVSFLCIHLFSLSTLSVQFRFSQHLQKYAVWGGWQMHANTIANLY